MSKDEVPLGASGAIVWQVGAWVYILRCCDGSYYTGLTRGDDPACRLSQHELKASENAYTASRLPVVLVFAEHFERIEDAAGWERRIKGWSRAKKEALIAGDFEQLVNLSRNRQKRPDNSLSS